MSMQSDTLRNLQQGVLLDDVGAPVGYRLKRKTKFSGEEEVEVRAFDQIGRRLTLHIFDGEPDQVRGISPWAPAVKVFRQFDQLADATLTTTLIQTVFAAMFKSGAKPEDVLAAMQSESEGASNLVDLLTEKSKWYEKADVNLGVHGKILHGFPGDELQFFRSEHPNANYQPFAKFLLLEGSAVGAMTFEEFTGDFSTATYASLNNGMAINWPRVLHRRHNVAAPVYQALYENWLEEDIEQGGTPFPGGVNGYFENRDAAAQAIWRGGAKPSADDLKTAKALETWRSIGVPDAVIFAALGGDVDEWYALRAREKQRRTALGIEDPAATRKDPVGDALVTQADGKKD
jgi:capsid protein